MYFCTKVLLDIGYQQNHSIFSNFLILILILLQVLKIYKYLIAASEPKHIKRKQTPDESCKVKGV